MAIKIHLDDILKERNMTSKELCKKVHITEANLSILRKMCIRDRCNVGEEILTLYK